MHELVSIRVFNAGQFPRHVRENDAIALLTTGVIHEGVIAFQFEDDEGTVYTTSSETDNEENEN